MTNTVKIEGVELHKRKTVRNSRVPGPSAKLVLTDTTKHTLRLMAEAVNLNEPVVLEGETSAGKSAATLYLSYRTKTPIYWVNLCEQTDPSELIGKYVPTEDSDRFEWMDGTLIRAMKEGAWLFLDDINLAPSSILERMNSLLDEDACITVTEHTGEPVRPAEGFRLFAARNPLTYQGRQRLSVAFVNKFTQIYVEEQTDDEKVKILSKRGVDKSTAHAMVEFAGKLIAGMEEEKLDRSRLGGYRFGLRDLLRWSEYIETYTTNEEQELSTAFGRGAMYVYYDRLEAKEARKLCFDLLSQCSLNETQLDLVEILEGRDLAADIKPTVAELFKELTKGVNTWALRATEVLLASQLPAQHLAGLGALLQLPTIGETLATSVCEELASYLSSEEAHIRAQAILELQHLPETSTLQPRVREQLIHMADAETEEPIRKKILGILGKIAQGDSVICRILLAHARNGSEAAVSALGECGTRDEEVVTFLLTVLRSDAQINNVVGSLRKLGTTDKAVIKALFDQLQSHPGYLSLFNALTAIALRDPTAERTVKDGLRECVRQDVLSDDSHLRVAWLMTLNNNWVQAGRLAILPEMHAEGPWLKKALLARLLQTPIREINTISNALSALGALGPPDHEVVDAVLGRASDPGLSQSGRFSLLNRAVGSLLCCAAERFPELGESERIVEAVLQLLRDTMMGETPRREAIAALVRLAVKSNGRAVKTQRLVEALLDCLQDAQGRLREKAAESLGSFGESSREVLAALLDRIRRDDEGVVVISAARALGQLQAPAKIKHNAARTLIRRVKDGSLKSSDASKALCHLGRIDTEVRAFLQKQLRSSGLEAACALTQLGEPCPGVGKALRAYYNQPISWSDLSKYIHDLLSAEVEPVGEFFVAASALDLEQGFAFLFKHRGGVNNQGWLFSQEIAPRIAAQFKDDCASIGSNLLFRNAARIAFYLNGSNEEVDISALRVACEICGGSSGPLVPDREIAELVLTRGTVSRLRSLLRAVRLNHAVALVGETGVGKTALIRFLAYLTNHNYVRINLKDMAEVSELIGGYVPTEDGTLIWKDGLLVKAMKEGHWVVLDEANLAGPGILERLNQLLDRDGYLELQEKGDNNDKPIRAHADFRLFVTMNPTDYAGRNAMSPAFVNRFVVKWYKKLTSKELTAIVKTQYDVSEGMAQRLVTFHQGIADSAEHRELGRQRAERYVYTLRDLQALMSRVKRLSNGSGVSSEDLVRCVRDVYGARLSHDEDRELFETHLKACFN